MAGQGKAENCGTEGEEASLIYSRILNYLENFRKYDYDL
jgi:hypothetical protein